MMEMYFIALLLPEELNKKVKVYKEWMKEKYNCKVGPKSPAHITIIPPFWMNSELERLLIETTDFISSGHPPFTLNTTGFDAFRPRTLFIAVAPNPRLNNLKKNAEEAFIAYPEFNIKKENRPFHPHITIATRDLHKAAFYEAWEEFAEKKFSKAWLANNLSILKHNKKEWDVLHTSHLQKTV